MVHGYDRERDGLQIRHRSRLWAFQGEAGADEAQSSPYKYTGICRNDSTLHILS
jgi:hypothetical protein